MPSYPNNLPGVLVSSNQYSPKPLTRRTDRQGGAPTFRRKDVNGWVEFDVSWTFDAGQMQFFRSWFRYGLNNGTALFDIDICVNGRAADGSFEKLTHQCFFQENIYRAVQNGPYFNVTATLLAISEVISA